MSNKLGCSYGILQSTNTCSIFSKSFLFSWEPRNFKPTKNYHFTVKPGPSDPVEATRWETDWVKPGPSDPVEATRWETDWVKPDPSDPVEATRWETDWVKPDPSDPVEATRWETDWLSLTHPSYHHYHSTYR